jgi:hypothetical protein
MQRYGINYKLRITSYGMKIKSVILVGKTVIRISVGSTNALTFIVDVRQEVV